MLELCSLSLMIGVDYWPVEELDLVGEGGVEVEDDVGLLERETREDTVSG